MASTVWKGSLGFGLVSIPVRLYRAARPERVSFRQFRRAARPLAEREEEQPGPRLVAPRTGAAPALVSQAAPPPRGRTAALPPEPEEPEEEIFVPVSRPAFDAERGERVNRSEIVRGYEQEKGRFVTVEEDELRSLVPATSREMEIREFVRVAEIDPLYFESSYYVAPGPGGEKAYGMLFAALREAGYAALAEVAMHRRERVMVVRPGRTGLIAHTMFYESEVHAGEEYHAQPSLVGPKEMELAGLFVHSLAAPFEPGRYRDRYRERVNALVEGKAAAGQFFETGAAAPPPPPEQGDILEALRKSLAAIRKPPASEPAQPAPPAARAKKRRER